MISFIIIGRNEGWKLTKCFKSVFETIEYNKIEKYEVIYIDSKSNDDSIERAKKKSKINIFQITGEFNAAIARNIGAKEANGDILFFIDGDMEINKDFYKNVVRLSKENDNLYLTGQVIDEVYDTDWKLIKKQWHYLKIVNPTKVNSTGGIFLISKKLWNLVGGMKTKYKRSQDLDFSLRLAKKGYLILRYPEIICHHNTISHNNSQRMWSNISNFNIFYHKSLLTREHLFDKFFLKNFIRSDYTILILIITITLCFSFSFNSAVFWILYFISIILRSYINSKKEKGKLKYLFNRITFHIIKDVLSIIMIFTFFPKSHNEKYVKI
ncbi:MAG: glycosyltransferase [Candidatus Cloacimonetes bacterium]|nr:glycosyltransferase [Candidatus Cloacimonadota bacterium]